MCIIKSENQIKKLLSECDTISKIVKKMGYRSSKSMCDELRKELREKGIQYEHLKFEKHNKMWKTRPTEMSHIIKEVRSFTKLFEYFGVNRCSKSTSRMRKFLDENNIDYSHFCDNSKKNINPGDIFGKWTIIKEIPKKNKIHRAWLCRCTCGNEKEVYQTHLIQGSSNGCITCLERKGFPENFINYPSNHYHGSNNKNYKGYMKLSGNRFTNIKRGAERRNLEFSLTIDYMWTLYESQGRKCALTNLDIEFGDYSHEYGTASLDRINSNEGYIKGNVQWVHKHVNLMKNKLNQEYFIKLCKDIAHNN